MQSEYRACDIKLYAHFAACYSTDGLTNCGKLGGKQNTYHVLGVVQNLFDIKSDIVSLNHVSPLYTVSLHFRLALYRGSTSIL